MTKKWLGIDMGGTFTKLGIVDGTGKVYGKSKFETKGKQGIDDYVERLTYYSKELVNQLDMEWKALDGVGLGLPGFIDRKKGWIRHLPSLGWRNIKIKEKLEQSLQLPIDIDNDANVATLGECWCGAGKNQTDVICITIGTGIGVGIIANGQLIRGQSGLAGEAGHIVIEPDGEPCSCGQRGCMGKIASATAMVKEANRQLQAGKETSLKKCSTITTLDIFEAAKTQDQVATQVIERALTALTTVMSYLTVTLNPGLFIIGGGVSHAGDHLLNPLKTKYLDITQKMMKKDVNIKLATLGNDAGFIGAASLLKE
ncbi:ROK family glucokinase [Hazenella sp. IB182357]|uniref:Glucokinase n=1 Tax=Polycladospora coralii TaxID=2771432 RepID=A0A926NB47_9BACL|nr:ROK family glucokinase [Polycladospora coralii]MBD1373312.1 ROK family glucokinase [Polycladospora coralii]